MFLLPIVPVWTGYFKLNKCECTTRYLQLRMRPPATKFNMKQSPWEAYRCSDGKEISHLSCPQQPTHCSHTTTLHLLHHLLCGADSPGFLHMTHTFVCILSIVSEAGNPGIRSESDPDVADTVDCGDVVLWWGLTLLSCTEDNGGFSSRWDSALKLRVSWRVRGGTPAAR
jgi:hypothetical protein